MKPCMIVVAGPSGSGKSLFFPVGQLASHAFNVDNRAAELHGSYEQIPSAIRKQAQTECEAFVDAQIENGHTFAVETTLRSNAALRQAGLARRAGFETFLIYLCTADVEENIARVAIRGRLRGHSAPAAEIRDIYAKSLLHLEQCRALFDKADLYDTSQRWAPPRCVVRLRQGRLDVDVHLPSWIPAVWRMG